MRETALWPALRNFWHPVTFADAVGDGPFPARVLDEPIVLCRLEHKWRAFLDLCIHRGTPISWGWVEEDTIVCAYHGWAYGADCVCTRIPSLPPEHLIPKKARLAPFLAGERYGIVWVCLSGRARAPIPDFPALEDPRYRLVYQDQRTWRCSAARAMENFFDLGHFAWVHEGILGDRSDPIPPTVHIENDGETLRFWYEKPPDAAISNFLANNPTVSRELARGHWDVAVDVLLTKNTKETGIGFIRRDKMHQTIDIMFEYNKKDMKRKPSPEEVYTNDFVAVFPHR